MVRKIYNINSVPIKVFISYSTDDKIMAGDLKRGLELLGFSCFLAHEDIPAGEWRNQIDDSFERVEVFLPLLTNSAKNSAWLHQESGIAHWLKKKTKNKRISIVPLKLTYDPEGCLSIYQAYQLHFKNPIKPEFDRTDVNPLAKRFVKEIVAEERAKRFALLELKNASELQADLILDFSFWAGITFEDAEIVFESCFLNKNLNKSTQMFNWLSVIYERFEFHPVKKMRLEKLWKKYKSTFDLRTQAERMEDARQVEVLNKIFNYVKRRDEEKLSEGKNSNKASGDKKS